MTPKEQLIAALRSVEFTQTKYTLKNACGHCCLGVACEVYMRNITEFKLKPLVEIPVPWEQESRCGTKRFLDGIGEHDGSLPKCVQEWLGCDPCGTLDRSIKAKNGYLYFKLTDLNDKVEMTFDEIADFLETSNFKTETP
jgi:hypothetical protein